MSAQQTRKVVITGLGIFSSMGNDVETAFDNLLAGKSGAKFYEEWTHYNGLHSHLAAPAAEYDNKSLPRSVRRTMSRMSEMGALATFQALESAGLSQDDINDNPRVLLCLGSTSGSPDSLEAYYRKLIERNGPEGQLSGAFFKVMNHSVVANVASALGFRGATSAPASACSTSSQAIAMAWELIAAGVYDVVVAGGADEVHYTSASVFDSVLAATRGFNDNPQAASRPFDKDHDGLVVSEGAGIVVLESADHAKKRGAKIEGVLSGASYYCDTTHMSQNPPEAIAKTIDFALERAGVNKAQVDYVNAHATSTAQGDGQEAKGIALAVGEQTPVSSLKGNFGHSLAACGAIEVAMCLKMMQKSTILPTLNLEEVDPECDCIQHVKEKQSAELNTVVTTNFAFGGMNTCLVLSKS